MFSRRFVLFFFITVAIVGTRFIKPDWGSSYFFHPDENNMASALSQLTWQNLNPHFFAYGQFPLYFGFILLKLFCLPITFPNSIMVLRFMSATFSVASIVALYHLSFFLFNSERQRLAFLALLTFTPGLIQLAHFGTTESLLNFIFAIELLLAFRIDKNPSQKINYFLTALFLGIGLATKISAIFFVLPFLVVNRSIVGFLFVPLFSTLVSLLLSPYNLIAFSDFMSSMRYETSVATGKLMVFYTQQFVDSVPYLFQLQKIFPYSAGIFMFIFSLAGLFFIRPKKKTFIIAIPCLVYFLYFGQVFTKWSRFMSPLFFVPPLLTALLIKKIKNRAVAKVILALSILPGVVFLKQYFEPDIRLQASSWINQNIPINASVLSESGNVINIPVRNEELSVDNFNFYDYQPSDLTKKIDNSDYILIPSRRVFKNNFAQDYYQQLFSGRLGFSLVKQFSPTYDLFLNSENAEETWSVFDHPTIRVFKKNDD